MTSTPVDVAQFAFLPKTIVGALGAMGSFFLLLLDCLQWLRVRRLLFRLHLSWRSWLGGGGEAPMGRERWGAVWVEAFGLQLGLLESHLPLLHFSLQQFIVRLLSCVQF